MNIFYSILIVGLCISNIPNFAMQAPTTEKKSVLKHSREELLQVGKDCHAKSLIVPDQTDIKLKNDLQKFREQNPQYKNIVSNNK